MRPVILVGSCVPYAYKGYHQAVMETWGAESAIDYFFMVGNMTLDPPKVGKDRLVRLPCADDYQSIAYKTREGHRWARKQGYDFIFQCWADTYVLTQRMLMSGFEKCDYTGHFRGEEKVLQGGLVEPGCYASGGSGYWFSPKASDRLIQETPSHWAEDLWAGRVMRDHGFRGVQDYRYFSGGGYSPECVAIHLSRGTGNYTPDWMRETHQYIKNKGGL